MYIYIYTTLTRTLHTVYPLQTLFFFSQNYHVHVHVKYMNEYVYYDSKIKCPHNGRHVHDQKNLLKAVNVLLTGETLK